jgi:hypothetical protein
MTLEKDKLKNFHEVYYKFLLAKTTIAYIKG